MQRGKGGFGAAARQDPARAVGHAEQAAEPVEHDQLDLGRPRRFQPNAREEVGARAQHVAQHGGEAGRAGHKGEKARMIDAQRVGGDRVAELGKNLGKVPPLFRRRASQQSIHLGARLHPPDRLRGQRFEVMQQPGCGLVRAGAERGEIGVRERLGKLAAKLVARGVAHGLLDRRVRLLVLNGAFGTDVPAAIAAGGRLVVAAVAVEGAAGEELLQARTDIRCQLAGIGRQPDVVAAAIAMAVRHLLEKGGVMIVHGSRHHSRAAAQGAGHVQLRRDGLANERALVRQLVQEVGELLLDLNQPPWSSGAYVASNKSSTANRPTPG